MNDETPQSASPPCSAHEADPAYMGLLPRDEIVGELQDLLEAERAGARIARESAIEARDADATKIERLEHLLEDETHCCKLLIACLEQLGETPSTNIGDFYQKCMAIENLDDRLNLVDKGQRWVLRKVDAMLPRLSDPKLVEAMKDVRDRHR